MDLVSACLHEASIPDVLTIASVAIAWNVSCELGQVASNLERINTCASGVSFRTVTGEMTSSHEIRSMFWVSTNNENVSINGINCFKPTYLSLAPTSNYRSVVECE